MVFEKKHKINLNRHDFKMKDRIINWNNDIRIEIKEDMDKMGVIIDVFNRKTENHVDSITVWYDDLTSDEGHN